MKFLKLVLLGCALLPLLAHAAPDYAAAHKLVQETANEFVKGIKAKKTAISQDSAVAFDLAEQIVLPHIDFRTMSKRVLARNWRVANAQQQTRFINEFKLLLLRTYARSIVEYADERIEFLPYKTGKRQNQVVIKTEVKPATGNSISIDYTMAFKDGLWKVIDIKIEHVSLVINYRSTFSRDIRRVGMDKFLDKLTAKNGVKHGG